MVPIATVPVLGSSGNDVLALENALAREKCYLGTLDGLFGSGVKAAISKFQKAHGLTGSGELGPKTLELLNLELVPSSPSQGASITRPFPRKHSSRHLHPTLRLLMEAKIFPGGKIPDAFLRHDFPQIVCLTARGLAALGIKEATGHNDGTDVGYIQGIIGPYRAGGTGDSWCMSTDQCIIAFIEDFLRIESPVLSSESCVETWDAAVKIPGLTTKTCEAGSFFDGEHQKSKGKGHTGTVLAPQDKGQMLTFEGNRDNHAYIGTRSQEQTGDLKILGFIRIFPYNKLSA